MHVSRTITPGILLPALLLLLFPEASSSAQPLICSRVIDEYTLLLDNQQSVRLIGVDTPATQQPDGHNGDAGKEALAFTRRMVEGKSVRVEYDLPQRDRYDRVLAYVYLLDGTFINAEILKQGYGIADTSYPFTHRNRFRQYEKEARESRRGLWAAATPHSSPKLIREEYIGSRQEKIYHIPSCTIAQKITPADSRKFISLPDAAHAGYQPCRICRPPYHK